MKQIIKKLSEYPAIEGFNNIATAVFRENHLDINSEADLEKYLPDQLHSYETFCELLENCEKLKGTDEFIEKLRNFPITKSIKVVGDYDVDGITATSICLHTLSMLGYNVSYKIPNRIIDGYGMTNIISDITDDLIITVDTGISSKVQVNQLLSEGKEVIITDHHIPSEDIPENVLIVDPKYNNDSFSDICGAFVALKLMYHFVKEVAPNRLQIIESIAPLAGIATITDLMPMLKENRLLVRKTLETIEASKWDNYSAIRKVVNAYGGSAFYKYNQISATEELISFYIGPAINAVSRVHGDASSVVYDIIKAYSNPYSYIKVNRDNISRQYKTKSLLENIGEVDISQESIIIPLNPSNLGFFDEDMDYNKGIYGIIASQLLNKYKKTVFVGSYNGTDKNKFEFSCRAPSGYNLNEGIQRIKEAHPEFEISGGGHASAMGVRLRVSNTCSLNTFQQYLNEDIRKFYIEPEEIIFEWEPELENNVIQTLFALQPFGKEFEKIKFTYTGEVKGYDFEEKIMTLGELKFKTYSVKSIEELNERKGKTETVNFTISFSNGNHPEFILLK